MTKPIKVWVPCFIDRPLIIEGHIQACETKLKARSRLDIYRFYKNDKSLHGYSCEPFLLTPVGESE